MSDRARDAVRDSLRKILFDMPDLASCAYFRDNDHNYRFKFPWPAPGRQREKTFAQIEHALYDDAGPGRIIVQPDRTFRDRRYELTWPAAADLFSAVHPPEVPAPRQVTSDAKGEPVEVPLVARPPKASETCADNILELLDEVQRRLTTTQLVEGLCARHLEWSTRVVEATCSWLVARGLLDNGRDARGRGYGLARWQRREA